MGQARRGRRSWRRPVAAALPQSRGRADSRRAQPPPQDLAAAEDLPQLHGRYLRYLIERACLWGLVLAPAQEGRAVAEAVALQVVEGHLAHELGSQRLPAGVFAAGPAVLRARRIPAAEPTVASIRFEKVDELAALGHFEARGAADVLQHAVAVVQPEQQRADARLAPVLV